MRAGLQTNKRTIGTKGAELTLSKASHEFRLARTQYANESFAFSKSLVVVVVFVCVCVFFVGFFFL